jgi:hypothetical protein
MRYPWKLLAAIGLVAIMAGAGCSEAATPSTTSTPQAAGPVDLPYNPDPPKDAKIIANLVGDAGLDGGCVWLRQGTTDLSVLWPPGFTAEFDPARIIDPTGTVVAQEGDRVELTGSFAADPTAYQPHRCVIGTELWLAGTVRTGG